MPGNGADRAGSHARGRKGGAVGAVHGGTTWLQQSPCKGGGGGNKNRNQTHENGHTQPWALPAPWGVLRCLLGRKDGMSAWWLMKAGTFLQSPTLLWRPF